MECFLPYIDLYIYLWLGDQQDDSVENGAYTDIDAHSQPSDWARAPPMEELG